MAQKAWLQLGTEEAERQVRRAWGLDEQPSVEDDQRVIKQFPPGRPPRRQFAKDGDVPVEVRSISNVRNHREELTAELIAARETQHHLESELAEARQAIENLNTKLAHQSMSLREAQERRAEAERALEALSERKPSKAPEPAPKAPVAPIQKRPRGRPRKHPVAPVVEQRPIWNDSWLR